jgi:hypothetical protein
MNGHTWRIIVSLTCISSRLKHVHKTVSSILQQRTTIRHQLETRLYVSEEPHLLDEGCPPELTPELQQLQSRQQGAFRVIFTPNIGPHRKILPLLKELSAQPPDRGLSTMVCTADDDTLYPPDWLETLVTAFENHRCVVGYRGRRITCNTRGEPLPYRQWSSRSDPKPSLFNVPTGKDGVLYCPYHLHPAVADEKLALQYAGKADDLWLKVHALLSGTLSYLARPDLTEEFPFASGEDSRTSLWYSYNKHGGNDEALRLLDQYLANEHSTSLRKLLEKGHASRPSLRSDLARAMAAREAMNDR